MVEEEERPRRKETRARLRSCKKITQLISSGTTLAGSRAHTVNKQRTTRGREKNTLEREATETYHPEKPPPSQTPLASVHFALSLVISLYSFPQPLSLSLPLFFFSFSL